MFDCYGEETPRYLLTVVSTAGWWEDVEIQADILEEIYEVLLKFKEENSGNYTGAILEDVEFGEVVGEYPF